MVALWKTTSKPATSGRKFTGEAKVLSMTVTIPSRFPKSATWSSRPTRISGLVIVSTRKTLVRSVRAASQVSGRPASTKLNDQPRSAA